MESKILKSTNSIEELEAALEWFSECDLSYVAIDSETMGVQWRELHKEWAVETSETRKKFLAKEMDGCKSDALNHRKNLLGCVQLAANYWELARDDGPEGVLKTHQRGLVIVTERDDFKQKVADYLEWWGETVWCGQNLKFDIHQFKQHLPTVYGKPLAFDKIHDTQLCHALIHGSKSNASTALKFLPEYYSLPPELQKKDVQPFADWWDTMLDELYIEYALYDVWIILPIVYKQIEIMKRDNLLRARKLECNLITPLVDIEDVGLRFDKEKMHEFMIRAKEFVRKNEEVYASLFNGISHSAPLQVLKRLKEVYPDNVPIKRQYNKELRGFEEIESVDKYALLEAGYLEDGIYPAVKAYYDIKEVQTKINTVKKWLALDDGKLYVNFFQVPTSHSEDSGDGGARTGRMSTSPQMQNISNFLKQFIVAPPGYVIFSSDAKGIELCILGHYTGDERLKQAASLPLHSDMAVDAFSLDKQPHKKSKEYRIGKEINFGFPYGMYAATFCRRVLRATMGKIRVSAEDANNFRQLYFRKYPGVLPYHQREFAQGCLNGYSQSKSGRRRYYNVKDRPVLDQEYVPFWNPYIGGYVGPFEGKCEKPTGRNSSKFVRSSMVDGMACYRAADWRWRNVCYNMPIQGTGADIIKLAILNVHKNLDSAKGYLFGTVHDSLDGFAREDCVEEVLRVVNTQLLNACNYYISDVNFAAEHSYGRSWASAPEDILTDSYGLWVIKGDDEWTMQEFQQEVSVTNTHI